jgi:hypothetical protein
MTREMRILVLSASRCAESTALATQHKSHSEAFPAWEVADTFSGVSDFLAISGKAGSDQATAGRSQAKLPIWVRG